MRLTDIFLTANGNLWRSKLRTALTVTAILIGTLTLALTNSIRDGVSAYIDKQLGNLGAEDALIVRPQQEEIGLSGAPQKYNPDSTRSGGAGGVAIPILSPKDLTAVRNQDGILSAEPLRVSTPEYIQAGAEKYKVQLAPYIEGTRMDIIAGRTFSAANDANELVLPIAFIGPLGFGSPEKAVGSIVKIGVKQPAGNIVEIESRVVGVQQESLAGPTGVTANRPLAEKLAATQTAGLPEAVKNQYPAVIARFDTSISEERLQSIKDGLKQKGYQAMTVEDSIGVIKQFLDAITNVLIFFAAIALVAASFGIINTLLMAVQERNKEIGLMKAMGMSRARIFTLFSTEAVLIGLWGSLLGVGIANLSGRIINNIASDTFLKDLPGFELTSFTWQSMLTIIVTIMIIAFLAGTLPARRAAKKNPIDALRYE